MCGWQDLANQTLEGVRACRDLRPPILDDLGLRVAIEWLSESWSARGIPCGFECAGQERRLPQEAEVAIFRIVQEALSNVWRHANARRVGIDLHYLPKLVEVRVRDEGQGFDLTGETGMGIVNMRERALSVGAELTISAAPQHGCTVALSWPQLA